jgi:ribosome biogenesis protein NSA1
MRVLDLETGKLQWKAKNLPPDPQTLLQQPMWTTTIQFIHTPTNYLPSSDRAPTYLAATGTAYKQVQIYDIRASSPTHRPVLYTPENLLPHRITTLCQLRDGNTLAVGDAIGDCHLLDMRKMHSGKQYSSKFKHAKEDIGLGRLVGPGGSIRQLCMHPTLPYLACVGLDRKLWTWDVNRGKMIDCIYLRQRLNCCLFCDDESWDNANGNDNEDGMVKYNEGVNDDDMEDEVEDYVDSEDDGNDQANRSSESFEETDSESGEDQSQSENEDSDSDKGLEEVEDEEANPRKRRKKHPRR